MQDSRILHGRLCGRQGQSGDQGYAVSGQLAATPPGGLDRRDGVAEIRAALVSYSPSSHVMQLGVIAFEQLFHECLLVRLVTGKDH